MIGLKGSEKLAKQLEEFSLTFKVKLKNMVEGFAEDVVVAASNATPEGNQADIDKPGKYRSLYLGRQKHLGIPLEAGFHRGAWGYSENNIFNFNNHVRSQTEMKNDFFGDFASNYKLGDRFFVGAAGPAFIQLQNGLSDQAPNGIEKPTLAMIRAVIMSDLLKHYNKV